MLLTLGQKLPNPKGSFSFLYKYYCGTKQISKFSGNIRFLASKSQSTSSERSIVVCNLIGTQLKSRALIHLRGPDTLPFLQGLITNDIQHLESQDSIYALFLNQGGRVLFDSIIYKVSKNENEVLIECDSSFQSNLISHLKIYRVRKRVEITDASKELVPWVVFHPWDETHNISLVPKSPIIECCSNITPEQSSSSEIEKRHKLILDEGRIGIQDPRIKELGWRFLISPGQKLESLDSKLQIATKDSEAEYRSYLYHLGVGEGSKDLPPGNCFPLESNGDYLHGISFHKGCYIGQELTARTHHTGVVRKRLLPFSLPDTAEFSETTDFSTLQLTNSAGKSVGKVRNVSTPFGLALVRIEEAFSSTEIRCDKYPVIVQKPFWWPIELSKESLLTSSKK